MILVFFGILFTTCAAVPANVKRSADSEAQNTNGNPEICMSPECIFTASTILKNMDTTVDPCDDFYKFTCGNYIKNTEIPDDKTNVNTFHDIEDTLHSKLRMAIAARNDNDLKAFHDVRNFYDVCMNQSRIEAQGITVLQNIITKLGGWPVLLGDEWNDETFNWLDVMTKCKKLGYDYDSFLSVEVSYDLKNSSQFMINIDQASLGLPREYLLHGLTDKAVKAYLQFQIDIAVFLGADKDRATQELTDSLNFEIQLANITIPKEERRDFASLYNPATIQELSEKYPSIPWKDYIDSLLSPIETVTDKDVVNVWVPKFIPELLQLLEVTPKRVQANYALWGPISSSITFLTKDIRKVQLDYVGKISGQTQSMPRWRECIAIVSKYLPIGVGALYARNFFQEDVKRSVVEMVNNIRNTFEDILTKTEWMDDTTKARALEKAQAMIPFIAYPDELMDDRKLEKYFENLTIIPTNYLEAFLNASIFGVEGDIKRLRKPVNKTDWVDHGSAATINAFYSPVQNSIEFPAGFLQGILFNVARPKYMNYGGIGSIIGHEITHGFDDQGRTFDKDGNLADWWEPSTKSQFLEKAQCIIKQYGNYTATDVGINLNGVNTQGENIADNGGMKGSYLAYTEWESRNGVEPQLPGLNYTGQQMFWISAANAWCITYKPEILKRQILTDAHSPGEFRVIGSLTNRPEFASDFACPLGSKMNPEHKCSVW